MTPTLKRLLLALALAAPAVGCGAKEAGKDAAPEAGKGGKGGKAGGKARADLTYAVNLQPVEKRKLQYQVTAPGTVDAFERVQMTARVAGAVDKVGFTEGQLVKAGDSLVTIDAERFQLAVNTAKAGVDKADATLKDVQASVQRREGASTTYPGLIPGEELATYRSKALVAQADVEVAKENQHAAELNLRDAHIRAPIDGVIQTRTVETGQYVQAGYVMATLLRTKPMLMRFTVGPQDAPRIKPDMIANFTLRESNRSYAAKITLVSQAADPDTRMVSVTSEVVDDGHGYWLRPGSFADVTVDIDAARDAPVVPRSAVRATERGNVVYVVDGAIAHEKVVTLGMSTKDGMVEVRSGLVGGEQLVVQGGESMAEGVKVKVVPAGDKALAPSASSATPGSDAPAVPPAMASPEPAAGAAEAGADGGHHHRKAAATEAQP